MFFEEIFSSFGAICDIRIVTHKSGKSKGCAYIEFENDDDAEVAVKAGENLILLGLFCEFYIYICVCFKFFYFEIMLKPQVAEIINVFFLEYVIYNIFINIVCFNSCTVCPSFYKISKSVNAQQFYRTIIIFFIMKSY